MSTRSIPAQTLATPEFPLRSKPERTEFHRQSAANTGGLSLSAGRDPRKRHNLTTLKRAVKVLGGRTLDRRTSVGKALASWRTALVNDLGGEAAVSTQQQALVDLAAC